MPGNRVDPLGVPILNVPIVFYTLCEDAERQTEQSRPGNYGGAMNGRFEGREATGLASVTGFDLDFD